MGSALTGRRVVIAGAGSGIPACCGRPPETATRPERCRDGAASGNAVGLAAATPLEVMERVPGLGSVVSALR